MRSGLQKKYPARKIFPTDVILVIVPQSVHDRLGDCGILCSREHVHIMFCKGSRGVNNSALSTRIRDGDERSNVWFLIGLHAFIESSIQGSFTAVIGSTSKNPCDEV